MRDFIHRGIQAWLSVQDRRRRLFTRLFGRADLPFDSLPIADLLDGEGLTRLERRNSIRERFRRIECLSAYQDPPAFLTGETVYYFRGRIPECDDVEFSEFDL